MENAHICSCHRYLKADRKIPQEPFLHNKWKVHSRLRGQDPDIFQMYDTDESVLLARRKWLAGQNPEMPDDRSPRMRWGLNR